MRVERGSGWICFKVKHRAYGFKRGNVHDGVKREKLRASGKKRMINASVWAAKKQFDTIWSLIF